MSKKKAGENGTAETKEVKLLKAAPVRVNRALKAIQQVGNLASLKPAPAQTSKIVAALQSAVKNMQARLEGNSVGFTLEEPK